MSIETADGKCKQASLHTTRVHMPHRLVSALLKTNNTANAEH